MKLITEDNLLIVLLFLIGFSLFLIIEGTHFLIGLVLIAVSIIVVLYLIQKRIVIEDELEM